MMIDIVIHNAKTNIWSHTQVLIYIENLHNSHTCHMQNNIYLVLQNWSKWHLYLNKLLRFKTLLQTVRKWNKLLNVLYGVCNMILFKCICLLRHWIKPRKKQQQKLIYNTDINTTLNTEKNWNLVMDINQQITTLKVYSYCMK